MRRLRVDQIDLYQLHSPDDDVPYEESVGALAELKDEGKIARIGVSNVNADQLATARELTDIVSVQNRFNLSDRSNEDVLEICTDDGLAFLPWFPLGSGNAGRGGERDRRGPRRERPPGGDRLAARPLPGDRPDPGHLERRPPGRERGRGRARAAPTRSWSGLSKAA